jgi:RHS repeat-associated protein
MPQEQRRRASLLAKHPFGGLPFGDTRYTSGGIPTRYRFTGQRSYTPDFGLYYYGSRWYDPALGRFIQPDTIVPNPANLQHSNPQRTKTSLAARSCVGADRAALEPQRTKTSPKARLCLWARIAQHSNPRKPKRARRLVCVCGRGGARTPEPHGCEPCALTS